jgi:hypothetical protein
MAGMRSVELAGRHFSPVISAKRHEQNYGTQTEFAALLGCLRKTDVHLLPDLSGSIDHEGRISDGLVGSLGNGMHVSQDIVEEWTSAGHSSPDRVTFKPQPLLRVGREDSRRKVFFGSMQMQWFNGSQHEQTEQVAIKPFEGIGTARTAMHELAMYQYFKQQSVPSIDILGVLVAPIGKGGWSMYTISRFEPSLTTMDNINWRELDQDKAWSQVDTIAVRSLVKLHEHLLFHGDTYFRNFAFRDENEDIVIIDAEQTVSSRRHGHPSSSRSALAKKMSADFTELTHDVDSSILGGQGLSDVEKFEKHNRHVFLPYRERLAHGTNSYHGLLIPILDQVVEVKYDQATGAWTPGKNL